MGNAEFVLLPSICYEGCSMTVIEAFSLGKPVIATDIGFMHEAISAVGMNTVFPMKDYNALRHKVIELWNDPDLCSQYGKIARNEYENKYSEPIDIANLTKIYYIIVSVRIAEWKVSGGVDKGIWSQCGKLFSSFARIFVVI